MSDTVTKEYRLIREGNRVAFTRKIKGTNKRVPIETYNDVKIPNIFTFTDKNGDSKTIRYLRASNEIYQDAQIKAGFPANLKYTQQDRDDLNFKNEKLITSKKNLIAFIDTAPINEAFVGDRGENPIMLREYKAEVEVTEDLDLGLKQAQAVVAMHSLSEDVISTKLLQIFGSHYQLPETLKLKKQAMQAAINDSEIAVNIILAEDSEDNNDTFIGKAINAGVLSFVEKPDQVMLKRNGSFVDLLPVSADHSEEQKIALFRDMLRTDEGKSILVSLKEALTPAEEKKSKKKEELKTE